MSDEGQIEAFEKIVGPIGGTYGEEEWHCRFGVFCMGWKKASELAAREVEKARILQFSPTGDNHHNAALCPHCGEPLREAVDIMRKMLESDGHYQEEAWLEAHNFIKRSGL